MELSTPNTLAPAAARRGFAIDPKISIGTLLHVLTLILSTLWFADRISFKQQQILDQLRADHARIERVEKYLSSKDAQYWQIVQGFTSRSEEP